MTLDPKMASLYFVLAPGYHGVTRLSSLLNLHPQIMSLGTGNPSMREDQYCSCGETVSNCPFWSGAEHWLDVDPETHPLETMLPQMPVITASERINKVTNAIVSFMANEITPKCWSMIYEPAERFFNCYDKFYTFCQDRSRHKIYVDCERSLSKFMVLASMDFPVRGAVHITRDPRGYAAAQRKHYPDMLPEQLGIEWAAAHSRIRRVKKAFFRTPFLTMRYEDLMANPEESFKKTVSYMGCHDLDRTEMIKIDQKNHLLGLAPSDQELGLTSVTENWQESLTPEEAAKVVEAAGPLFSEFGYKS